MTNPDPKCPVMRRRPLAVTFGPQRSARGGRQVWVGRYVLGRLNLKKNLLIFAPALQNTVHTVQLFVRYRGWALVHGGQRPISLEYQVKPPPQRSWGYQGVQGGARGHQGASGGSRLPPAPKRVIKQQNNGSKPWFKVPKVCPDQKGMVLIHF